MTTRRTSRPWVMVIQVLLGLIALVSLSSARVPRAVWTTDLGTRTMFGFLAVAFVLLVAGLLVGQRRGRPVTPVQVLLVGSLAMLPFVAAAHLFHPEFSRVGLVLGPVLAMCIAWVIVGMQQRVLSVTVLVALLAVAGLALQAGKAVRHGERERVQKRLVTSYSTARYALKLTTFEGYIPRPETNQGGLTSFRDGYLVVTGDGDLYFFRRSDDGQGLSVDRWPIKVPMNAAEFAAAAGDAVNLEWFRTADVLATESGGGFRLFVTHHFWKADQQCWVFRVSSLSGEFDAISESPQSLHWSTVFETRPCVPLQTQYEPKKFEGLFNGGRMILVGDDELLVSVGDHGLEAPGYGLQSASSQDPAVSYGKTILVHLEDGTNEVFSLGHRNPQGLHRGPSGDIWLTEHGPQGGDELNRIHRGGNYGWPLATNGVQYGTHRWPLAGSAEQVAGFEEPFMSWYPSIGPSNLIEVTSPLFGDWRGDLLMASLRDNSLWRFRVRSDRVVLSEQIKLDERLRDIEQGHRGEIVLWTDAESMIFVEPDDDAASGEALYSACAACHVPPHPNTKAVGPSLQGIVGRKVASVEEFAYSRSLQALGGTWTRERLDAFLANPNKYSPGTSMMFPGLEDPVSRANLLDYLASPAARLDVAPPEPITK